MTKQIHIKAITKKKTFYLDIYGKPVSHLFDKPVLSSINLIYHFDNKGFVENNLITHITGR